MRSPALSELPPAPTGRRGWPWTEESESVVDDQLPRVSIVMPSFNQASFLEAAVRSVLLQGYPDLELIVVDGGSTDGSVDVLRRYEPWLASWTSAADGGQYNAINKGFSESTGTVMAWLNSDDMLIQGALAAVGSVFRQLDVDWLTGIPTAWDEAGQAAVAGLSPRFHRDWIAAGYYEGRLLGWIQQESTFWTRALWERTGGEVDGSLRYAGDFELWRRFAAHSPLRVLGAQLAGFRFHAAQKTAVGLDGYYAEIDQRRGRLAPAWIRLGQRSSLTRRLVFDPVVRLRSRDGAITYDPALARWAFSR